MSRPPRGRTDLVVPLLDLFPVNILVANLGSTSFKYRLYKFDGRQPRLVARGGVERVRSHGSAIDDCLADLAAQGALATAADLDAVAFKTVQGGALTGCVLADESVEEALLAAADLAPAHNPPYAAGIRQFRERLPGTPLVALFETAFYQWVPDYASRYAVPAHWHAAGVRRYGFHGASHKFVAERSAELLGREDVAEVVRGLYQYGPRAVGGPACRVISCHLGGSSSVTGISDGVAIGSSMGLSPQSGLPQNNRVGDLDSAAIPLVYRRLGLPIGDIERQLVKEGGLLALSGLSNDLRDIRAAAVAGNRRAEMAIDVYVHSIRHWIGAFWLEMGGCDALVFTGGIGENADWLREMVCAGLSGLGLIIDPEINACVASESDVAADGSTTRVLVIPAQEELVVATEARRLLLSRPTAACERA
jgi:acetate kinase